MLSPNYTPWWYMRQKGFSDLEIKKNLLIVVHWTAGFRDGEKWVDDPYEGARRYLCLQGSGRSANYIIGKRGQQDMLVAEENVAWHAGFSAWRNYPTFGDWQSLNPCSIGIELSGPPSQMNEKGWPDAQIAALVALCKDIAGRNPDIKLTDHYTIDTTGQKSDVRGWHLPCDEFPWKRLLEETGIEEA